MLLCGEMIDIKLFGKILVIKKAWGMLNESIHINSYETKKLSSFAFLHLIQNIFIKINGGLYGD